MDNASSAGAATAGWVKVFGLVVLLVAMGVLLSACPPCGTLGAACCSSMSVGYQCNAGLQCTANLCSSPLGGSCASNSDCGNYDGISCANGHCCAASGFGCTVDSDCCSGFTCNLTSNGVRRCGPPCLPQGSHCDCSTLGNCCGGATCLDPNHPASGCGPGYPFSGTCLGTSQPPPCTSAAGTVPPLGGSCCATDAQNHPITLGANGVCCYTQTGTAAPGMDNLQCCSPNVSNGSTCTPCTALGSSASTSSQCCQSAGQPQNVVIAGRCAACIPSHSSQSCSPGQCCGTCCPNSSSNGSTCVDLSQDPANCGQCGATCSGLPQVTSFACIGSHCQIAHCAPGFDDCNHQAGDGCEVNLLTDPHNCRSCGTVCPAPPGATATCSGGVCNFTCATGTTKCNGACVNTQANSLNCGGCGSACANGRICQGGHCNSQSGPPCTCMMTGVGGVCTLLGGNDPSGSSCTAGGCCVWQNPVTMTSNEVGCGQSGSCGAFP